MIDVIVIGAGPAGSTAARLLSEQGKDVLILEKHKFPRSKLCAGGVTHKAIPLLPPGFEEIELCSHTKATIFYPHRSMAHVDVEGDGPLVHMVERKDFDHYLLRSALDAGAKLMEGKTVRAVYPEGKNMQVLTSNGDIFQSRYVVAADGCNSVIRNQVSRYRPRVFSLEATLRLDESIDHVILDFGWIPRGYGWIFPKNGRASVGIGMLDYTPEITRLYWDFLKRHGQASVKPKGYFLPMYSLENSFSHGNILFAGDAAHLVDPVTGEGIYQAIKSGSMVARALSEADDYNAGYRYNRLIKKNMLPELRRAFFLSKMIYTFPSVSLRAFRLNPDIGRAYAEIISGKGTYRDLLGPSIMGAWKILKVIVQQLGYKLPSK